MTFVNFSLEKEPSKEEKEKAEIRGLIEKAQQDAIGILDEEYSRKERFKLISRDGKTLIFFGADHTFEPAHPQYLENNGGMKKEMSELFSHVSPEYCALIVESHNALKIAELDRSAKDIITEYGEPGFATLIAKQQGVDVFCFEPQTRDLIDYLEKHFDKDMVFLMFVGSSIKHFKSEKNEHLEDFMGRYFQRFKKQSGWNDYDISFDHLNDIYKNFTGREFTPRERQSYAQLYNPTRGTNPLNEISRAEQAYRDVEVVEGVNELLKAGKRNIYIVYGNGHALTQRNALKYIMQENG